jgi:DNA-binding protein H-NS
MKQKEFDCVEMKRQAQARLMAEHEARKNKYSSYAEFIHETAATDPKIQAFREKIINSQRDLTSDTVSRR